LIEFEENQEIQEIWKDLKRFFWKIIGEHLPDEFANQFAWSTPRRSNNRPGRCGASK
jgi:hypothetical protein